jgi:hypothetical protein
MNPVTQKILDDLNDPTLTQFVNGWGQLEQLIIAVYRSGEATRADIRQHKALRKALQGDYAAYAEQLAAYWPETTIDKKKATEDPFTTLLSVKNARKFVGNWAIMQTLPAVRQALNEWLVDKLAASKE